MQSRQSIQLRQQQQLALTPQLQQSIRFLQLSAQELELEVAQALTDNPLLELEGQYDTDTSSAEEGPLSQDDGGAPQDNNTYLDEAEHYGAQPSMGERSQDDDYAPREAGSVETLRDHLLGQLNVTRATDRDKVLVMLLVDELDENGLLPVSIDDVVGYINGHLGVPEPQNTRGADQAPQAAVENDDEDADSQVVSREEMLTALRLLQSFDPPGVGGQSVAECLQIQLRQTQSIYPADVFDCAMQMVGEHLDTLAAGNFTRLRNQLGVSQTILQAAHKWVLSLNPKPGRAWAQSVADYVRPEVIVRKVEAQWYARLNPAVFPRLRVNPEYEQWLQSNKADESTSALQVQLQQAHGLMKSVAQRFETVLRVAEFIVRHQQAFFEQGPQAMQPLVLRDIADALELHESTVSRATRNKYAQTPWGVFELKYFLGTSLGGSGLAPASSGTAVRAMIRQLISAESVQKPLSDNKITQLLAAKGVDVARRTVAKYREAEGIDAASVRKAKARLKGA
ncbi:RNA polymerase factor sigma-54 [Neopusillimonas maritima]|uniref:RNA polymerase sigma-54 factor n=1 Tax=Neopusillimonas maritima TaxID=2026239 RepID=A0A3A1YVC5_9BURK|nr:RNA polymerase factor sigma-54 [Neopusillimonas maritima]RIY41496.1 RNA polymerase sigma-54 factor [Neopusillimonas maritima]